MSKLGFVLPACVFAFACGDNLKSVGQDFPPFIDGSVPDGAADAAIADAPTPDAAPTTVTIAGSARLISDPGDAPAVATSGDVVADLVSNDTAAGSGAVDGSGDFTLTAPLTAGVFDGYLQVTRATDLDTYFYPAAPFDASTRAPLVDIFSSTILSSFSIVTLTQQNSADGFIEIYVVDDTGAPVSGATVGFTPGSGTIVYDPNRSLPSTSTGSDGLAFIYNTTATTDITVSATKSGTTFVSHAVKARPQSITQTIVSP